MGKIKVYCGETVHCGSQEHPVQEVKNAEKLVLLMKSDKTKGDFTVVSNSPDFVSAIKYIGKKQGVETEFFLNGESCGNSIGPMFEDFNRALDMIDELGESEE